MKSLVISQNVMRLPVIDGMTGEILGQHAIPLFDKNTLSMSYLAVQSETDGVVSTNLVVPPADILYIHPEHAIAVHKTEEAAHNMKYLLSEHYTKLIGLPVYKDSGVICGFVTAAELNAETGALYSVTALWDGTERAVSLDEIAAIKEAVVLKAMAEAPPSTIAHQCALKPESPINLENADENKDGVPSQYEFTEAKEDIPAMLNAIQQELTNITSFLSANNQSHHNTAPMYVEEKSAIPEETLVEFLKKPTTESLPHLLTEPSTEPPTEQLTDLLTEPTTEPLVDLLTEPLSDRPTDLLTEPLTEPLSKPFTESITETLEDLETTQLNVPMSDTVSTAGLQMEPAPDISNQAQEIDKSFTTSEQNPVSPESSKQPDPSDPVLTAEFAQRLGNIESLLKEITGSKNVSIDASSSVANAQQTETQTSPTDPETLDPFHLNEPDLISSNDGNVPHDGIKDRIRLDDAPDLFYEKPQPQNNQQSPVPPAGYAHNNSSPAHTSKNMKTFWKSSAAQFLSMCLFLGTYIALSVLHIL